MGDIKNNTIMATCQNCNKNKVPIQKNSAYFGIICSECSKKNTVYTVKD